MLIFVKTLCILVEINVHICYFASRKSSHILSFISSKSGSFVQRQKRIAIYHVKKFVKESQL